MSGQLGTYEAALIVDLYLLVALSVHFPFVRAASDT